MPDIFDKLLAGKGLGMPLAHLDEPFSLNENGQIATVGDWMDQEAPESVRIAFGRNLEVRPQSRVRPVSDLNKDELRMVAAEVFKRSDPGKKLGIIGKGSYSRDELVVEIQRGSALGDQLVGSNRHYAQLLEKAIRTGKVFVQSESDKIDFPDFDF